MNTLKCSFFTLLSLMMLSSMVWAVPGTINYQGILTDSGGLPVSGYYTLTFRLFDADVGGTQLWAESQDVTVTDGMYSAQLGATTPLSGAEFSVGTWLEVAVGGETLSPRQVLASVPYALRVDEKGLPSNGLNEISNGLLTNQFNGSAASTSTPVAIPDNNPTGVTNSIVFPDYGLAENISVSLQLTNSDLSTVRVTLTDPDAVEYVLFDGGSSGTVLNTSYPNPTATLSGDLNSWVGRNPQGTWTLNVVDSGFLNNTTDGAIAAWQVSADHVSNQQVAVTGNLEVTGKVSGDGSGLTSLDWGSLTNVPAGFADGTDNTVTSVNGLTGGQITSPVGIGTGLSSYYALNVLGSVDGGAFTANGGGNAYGVNASAKGTSTNPGYYHYGLYGDASGASFNYGGAAYVSDSNATSNYGFHGTANYGANTYGLRGVAQYGTAYNYGVYGHVYSNNANATSYSVYGYASGSGTLYAGYFYGDAAILGNTTIGTATKDAGSQLKVVGTAGASGDIYGGYFENLDTDGAAYGLYVNTHGVTDRTSDEHYGIASFASGGYYNYGMTSSATDPSATVNYGLRSSAYNGSTNFGIWATASGGAVNYAGYFVGSIGYTGNLVQTSDRRLKENIRPLETPLSKLDAINGVYYNMKETPEVTQIGVIAQDVQTVLPEAVTVIDPENGYLGVSYTSLVPVLIEAVKELKAQNEALQQQNTEILERLEALEGGTK